MRNTRWWDVAIVAGIAVCVGLLFANDASAARLAAGTAILVVFALLWFAVGRRLLREHRSNTAFTVALVVLSGLATLAHPSLATIQTVVYPVVWLTSGTTRRGVIANIAVALSAGIGYTFSFGFTLPGLGEAAIVVALSLTFSLAMGLWISGIFDTSAERQALVDELRAAQASLAALSRDAGVTSERERLAREIHDTIAQDLTGLVLLTQQGRRLLAAGDVAGAESHLALLEDSARLALTETRSLVAATSPALLDDGGIAPALERLAERFSRETGIRVTAALTVEVALDRATEVVLLRCSQEGLANVRKHSGAASAAVELTATAAGTTLIVSDDGAGFDASVSSTGFGLSGMRDRLALLHGALEVETSPAGTRLIVTLPAVGSLRTVEQA